MNETVISSRWLARKKLQSIFLFLLIAYSIVRVLTTGVGLGWSVAGGDFLGTVPAPWVWSLNRTLAVKATPVQVFSYPEIIVHYPPVTLGHPRNSTVGKKNSLTYCSNFIDDREFKGCSDYQWVDLTQSRQSSSKAENFPFASETFPKKWGYGIVMHLVTLPLLIFDDYKTLFRVWFVFTWIFLLFIFSIWYKILFVETGLHSPLVFGLYFFAWFNFFPLYEALTTGAIEIFEIFLITLAITYFRKGKSAAGGVLIGLATMTKYLPLIFLAYLVFKRQWKAAISATLVVLTLFALTHFTLGWENNHNFFSSSSVNDIRTKHDSQSIASIIHRWAGGVRLGVPLNYEQAIDIILTPEARAVAKKVSRFTVLLVILFYAFIFLLKRKSNQTVLELGMLSILMLEIINYNHVYYYFILLIPFSIAFQYLLASYKVSGRASYVSIVLLMAYLSVAIVIPGQLFRKILSYLLQLDFRIEIYQAYSIPGMGCFLLLGWLTWVYLQRPAATKGSLSPWVPSAFNSFGPGPSPENMS